MALSQDIVSTPRADINSGVIEQDRDSIADMVINIE